MGEQPPLLLPPGVLEPTTAAPLAVPRARFQVYVSPGRCFWRLLGRNNRAYARSVDSRASAEEVRDLALLAARSAVDGHVDLTSTRGREWEWCLSVDGVAVARSYGPYGRRVECLASVERFRQVAPGSSVTFVRFADRGAGRVSPPVTLSGFRPGTTPLTS